MSLSLIAFYRWIVAICVFDDIYVCLVVIEVFQLRLMCILRVGSKLIVSYTMIITYIHTQVLCSSVSVVLVSSSWHIWSYHHTLPLIGLRRFSLRFECTHSYMCFWFHLPAAVATRRVTCFACPIDWRRVRIFGNRKRWNLAGDTRHWKCTTYVGLNELVTHYMKHASTGNARGYMHALVISSGIYDSLRV